MAATNAFAEFVVQQFKADCEMSRKKLFGEFGLFGQGRMLAVICDDRQFLTPTPGGRAWSGAAVQAAPYPGARPCFLIEDREWLSALARITIRELPAPRARKPGKHR